MCKRSNRHIKNVSLDPTRPHTKTQTHSKSPSPLSHTDAKTNACWINVVLNLPYYNRSANASWVNRCPGRSSLLSYKEQWELSLHPRTRKIPHARTHACTFWAVLQQRTSRLGGFILYCVWSAGIAASGEVTGSKLVGFVACVEWIHLI